MTRREAAYMDVITEKDQSPELTVALEYAGLTGELTALLISVDVSLDLTLGSTQLSRTDRLRLMDTSKQVKQQLSKMLI